MKHLKSFDALHEAKATATGYSALYDVEDGSGDSVKDWKKYIDRAKIPGVEVKTGESSLKHHKSVTVTAPTKEAAGKVIKALKSFGIDWPTSSDFQKLL